MLVAFILSGIIPGTYAMSFVFGGKEPMPFLHAVLAWNKMINLVGPVFFFDSRDTKNAIPNLSTMDFRQPFC